MDLMKTLRDFVTLDIAIDMGTTSTRIFNRGGGLALDEPSLIAVSAISGEVIATGKEANRLAGRCPAHIEVAAPLSQGVVMDFDLAELMLRQFMAKLLKNRAMLGARAVMVAPAGATGVEYRAFENIATRVGARQANLVEAPVAAAIGLGLPIDRPQGTVVFCLGGGSTQTAVFSSGEILFTSSHRAGGSDINEAISAGIRKKFGVQAGRHTIEQLKTTLGSAYPMEKDEAREVYGKDLVDGLPRAVFVSNWEIREMIISPLENIIGAIRTAFERIPPELAEDIKKTGVFLAGGASQLRGVNKLIEQISGVKCTVSKKGAYACLSGADKILCDEKKWRRYFVSTHTKKLTG